MSSGRILVGYGSTDGHTVRVAERIAHTLGGRGFDVRLQDLREVPEPGVAPFDGVVLGGSVHMGRHQRFVRDFARRYREALEKLPTAFFSVSMAATERSVEDRLEAEGYVQRFMEETGWRPSRVDTFAGALPYTRYGPLKRFVIKRIARKKGADTDTSRDHEYTDWEAVRRFAEAFAEDFLEGRAASPAPAAGADPGEEVRAAGRRREERPTPTPSAVPAGGPDDEPPVAAWDEREA